MAIKTRIQLKYDTYTNWSTANTELGRGEIAIVILTEDFPQDIEIKEKYPILFKVGPGKFNDLPWASNLATGLAENSVQSRESWAISEGAIALGENNIIGQYAYLIDFVQNDTEQSDVQKVDNKAYLKSFSLTPECFAKFKNFVQSGTFAEQNFVIAVAARRFVDDELVLYNISINDTLLLSKISLQDENNKVIFQNPIELLSYGDYPLDETNTQLPFYTNIEVDAYNEELITASKQIMPNVIYFPYYPTEGELDIGKNAYGEGLLNKANASAHVEGNTNMASGFNSHAEGSLNIALGINSHVEGTECQALGPLDHAEGGRTIASGGDSHSEGFNTIASGNRSHAEGRKSIASSPASHAEGNETQASGQGSHSEGERTQAMGESSHAEGMETVAKGIQAHAEGYQTKALNSRSHAEGRKTEAAGGASHAEGNETQAQGWYSHAEGNLSLANGESSHAEGQNCKANGQYSHAEGDSTIASNPASHAEGCNCKANGWYSHAEGGNTIAEGGYSHAEGDSTRALGEWSHAGGHGTNANADCQMAIGRYNEDDNHALFIVGNGQSEDNRSNAFLIHQDRVKLGYGVNIYDAFNDKLLTLRDLPGFAQQAMTYSPLGGTDNFWATIGSNNILYSVIFVIWGKEYDLGVHRLRPNQYIPINLWGDNEVARGVVKIGQYDASFIYVDILDQTHIDDTSWTIRAEALI